jgi:UDP-N-acetylmuramoyl-tripeptide--D-alanyl-D-alanine ligase
LWQALTGELPPLALPYRPIANACLDSRDVKTGDLFVALAGEKTDGHRYVGDAVRAGAQAVICEERSGAAAAEAGAMLVDCRRNRIQRLVDAENVSPLAAAPLAYLVDDSAQALQATGGFQRLHRCHPDLSVVAITGSVGKTSTKELTAAVLARRYPTLHSKGNLNSEFGLPLSMLELDWSHQRAVLEMGMYGLGEIHMLCKLARPRIGVITNVSPVHLSRLGTIERIAQAKAELVQALPSADDGGIAILNWDDERVVAMAAMTQARIFRYGLTPEADLWADEIISAGMEGIRFRFHYRPTEKRVGRKGDKVESVHVRVPLLGRHSVHTALRAAAVGLVNGLSWEEIVAGMQSMPGQIRLVIVPGIHGSTIIDDTYNASPASTVAALNLLHDLNPVKGGRRVAVLGDMRELGDYTQEGHKMVGRRAASVLDMLVTVGELGRAIGEEARAAGFDANHLFMMTDADQTVALLDREIRGGDLVLVKGSRALGMDNIVMTITVDAKPADHSHRQPSNQATRET